MEIFLTYIDKGGIIFSFLLFLSLLTVTIIIFKFIQIYLFKRLDYSKVLEMFDENEPSISEIKSNFLDNFSNSEKKFLNIIFNELSSNKTKNNIEQEINRLVEAEFNKIRSFLPSLEVIAQVSPLIGLLGTVIGMIASFNELELGGSLVDPSILAGGIWTALLTTAMGLIVAIPALVCHYFFDKKINLLYENFDTILRKISSL